MTDTTVPGAGTKGEVTREEPTRLQQSLARRAAESKATVPHLVLQVEADAQAATELLTRLEGITFTDLAIKATALALRAVPRANGAYRDGGFERYSRVNIALALPVQDALVAPTLFDADARPLSELAAERQALTERARSGVLTAPELAGATFTVFSLAEHGVDSFAPAIPPGQAAVLALGAVAPRAVVRDGAVVARETVALTLVCDNRILHGAMAAELLGAIRAGVEAPAS